MSPKILFAICCAGLLLASPLRPLASTPALQPQDKEWWYHPHRDHTPSGAPEDVDVKKNGVRFLGDTQRKVVYLTFDEGSEAGYTKKILDELKANGIHATFFVTRFYMKEAPDLLKRMLAEGHTIANHSATHPEHLVRKTDSQIQQEILLTAQYYKQLTGREMVPLFRPPCGACDERILRLAAGLGYRNVFWSMAYEDWTPKQKSAKFAAQFVMKYYHPGAIILLHPFASNTEGLGSIIKELKGAGYQFGSLAELH